MGVIFMVEPINHLIPYVQSLSCQAVQGTTKPFEAVPNAEAGPWAQQAVKHIGYAVLGLSPSS